MKNGEILKVRRSDNITFEVGEKLPLNGGIIINAFEYQQKGNLIIAVFSDNKIGLAGLRKTEIKEVVYKAVAVEKRMPVKDGYYFILIENEFFNHCWWFNNIQEWGKSKDEKGALKQQMVTHWLEVVEPEKSYSISSEWIDCKERLPDRECIALDGDGEQWIGNLWRSSKGVVICEFANPNGDSETIKVDRITHWTEKPKNPTWVE